VHVGQRKGRGDENRAHGSDGEGHDGGDCFLNAIHDDFSSVAGACEVQVRD
jgi:hypothetical protein